MKVIYNGNIIEESEVKLEINNRGFNYGDGLFETLIADNLNINYLDDHLNRFSKGLEILKIKKPDILNYDSITNWFLKLKEANNIEGLTRIKIIIWRKQGGLFSATSKEAEFMITAYSTIISNAPKQKALFYNAIKLNYSPISGFKKLSSLPYVMAGIFKIESEVDEVILVDIDDNVSECLTSNIFWIKADIIYTPSLTTGCLDGVMRKQIIKFLKENKIEIREGKFSKDHLLKADFVFSSNVAQISPIYQIEEKKYQEDSLLFDRIIDGINLH